VLLYPSVLFSIEASITATAWWRGSNRPRRSVAISIDAGVKVVPSGLGLVAVIVAVGEVDA